jgi:hypothetical protein
VPKLAAGSVRIVEGVDRRQAVVEHIEDADHAQHAVVGEFDQAGVHPALQQEVRVLLVAVLVHAAAGVPRRLVAQVELVVLVAKGERQLARLQAGVQPDAAALAARRLKSVDRHAHRNAGLAVVALRPVGEDAAAAKTAAHEFPIDLA